MSIIYKISSASTPPRPWRRRSPGRGWRSPGIIPTLTGVLALLLGATTVFAQMQISLNRIWGVAAKPQKSGILILLKNRMLSLAIILTIGFVLLVSLVLNVALRAVVAYAENWIPVPALLLTGAELVLSLVVISALFAVIFKVLPDAVIEWGDVWVGAVITAVLFIAGRYVIAFSCSRGRSTSTSPCCGARSAPSASS